MELNVDLHLVGCELQSLADLLALNMTREVVTEIVLQQAKCVRVAKSLVEVVLAIRSHMTELVELLGNDLVRSIMPSGCICDVLQHAHRFTSPCANRVVPTVIPRSGNLGEDALVDAEDGDGGDVDLLGRLLEVCHDLVLLVVGDILQEVEEDVGDRVVHPVHHCLVMELAVLYLNRVDLITSCEGSESHFVRLQTIEGECS